MSTQTMQEMSLGGHGAPTQLVRLLEDAKVPQRVFAEGQKLFEEGSRGDEAFFLAQGSVNILKRGPAGKDKLLDILNCGVIFGEMALLDEPVRSATAVAAAPVTVYAINRDMMRKLETLPEFSTWLLKTFSQRLRTLNGKVAQMEKLQEINTRMIMSQHKERARVARDLSEGPVQQFADFIMTCEILERAAEKKPEALKSEIKMLRDKLQKGLAKLNNLAMVLSPSDVKEVGFSETLYYLSTNMEREGVYKVAYRSDRIEADVLDTTQQNTLFLVLQDALRNLAELGNASQITVSLTKLPNRVLLTIADNGPGYDFDKVKQGFYRREVETFSLMRDRVLLVGGNMKIQTAPGQGTRLEIEVPLRPPES